MSVVLRTMRPDGTHARIMTVTSYVDRASSVVHQKIRRDGDESDYYYVCYRDFLEEPHNNHNIISIFRRSLIFISFVIHRYCCVRVLYIPSHCCVYMKRIYIVHRGRESDFHECSLPSSDETKHSSS